MKKTYKKLDELIDATGLKKTAIANSLGIDKSTLYKWRVDPRTIGIDGMEKLALICGVDFIDIYSIVKNFKQEVDFFTTE